MWTIFSIKIIERNYNSNYFSTFFSTSSSFQGKAFQTAKMPEQFQCRFCPESFKEVIEFLDHFEIHMNKNEPDQKEEQQDSSISAKTIITRFTLKRLD